MLYVLFPFQCWARRYGASPAQSHARGRPPCAAGVPDAEPLVPTTYLVLLLCSYEDVFSS